MSPYIGAALDVIVLIALGATIHLSLRLSRQFERLRADRQAFDTLISALNLASSRAEASIRAFKETASGDADALQEKLGKARAMAEELEIMIQAGDSLADRLTALASQKGADAEKAAPAAPPRTKAEQELLAALAAKKK